jgi:hypothetical protein
MNLSRDDRWLVPEVISDRKTIGGARGIRWRIHNGGAHRIVDEERLGSPSVHEYVYIKRLNLLGGWQHGGRGVEAQGGCRRVEFPSNPDDGVAVSHEQPVAKVLHGRRTIAGGAPIEEP